MEETKGRKGYKGLDEGLGGFHNYWRTPGNEEGDWKRRRRSGEVEEELEEEGGVSIL